MVTEEDALQELRWENGLVGIDIRHNFKKTGTTQMIMVRIGSMVDVYLEEVEEMIMFMISEQIDMSSGILM